MKLDFGGILTLSVILSLAEASRHYSYLPSDNIIQHQLGHLLTPIHTLQSRLSV